jgi:hypothetical protein
LSGAALGWQKNNPISMQENKKMVVLNIGCGTLDALSKRPELNKLADCLVALYSQSPFQLHLSGANFEKKSMKSSRRCWYQPCIKMVIVVIFMTGQGNHL